MPRPHRIATAIRFEPPTYEALKETADELGVALNWLVNKLCEEGMERMDLGAFSLVRSPTVVDHHGKERYVVGTLGSLADYTSSKA